MISIDYIATYYLQHLDNINAIYTITSINIKYSP